MALHRTMNVLLAAALLALSCAGCSDDEGVPGPSGASSSGGPGDCLQTLTPTGDDQEAVQTALIEIANGGTICFAAGTFSFTRELSLSQDSVTLRGAGLDETIFDFSGQTSGANGLAITGDSVTVETLTVKNTPGDGVRATDVKDITFREMAVRWDAEASTDNGAYGLYPVGSDGVRIEKCLVNGARDAGVYVGQSTHILVAESEAYGNVAGIEIENSTDAEVRGNHAHDNTAGILVFNLPNLPVQDGKRAKVHNNLIEQNNLATFAESGTVVAKVPAGCGVVLLASDDNELSDNEIKNNKSIGIAVLHYATILFGAFDDPAFDPYPQGNWVHDNVFGGNGTDPGNLVGDLTTERPIPDVMDDGCQDPNVTPTAETANCLFDGNGTYLDFDLCAMNSTDPAEVTCEHESLPPQIRRAASEDVERLIENFPHPRPLSLRERGWGEGNDWRAVVACLLTALAIGCSDGHVVSPEPEPTPGEIPYETLSEYDFFEGDLAAHQPAPGVVLYEVAASLWADHAEKKRFLVLPDGGAVEWTEREDWALPLGTVVIKAFSFPADLREPAGSARAIETRLLILEETGWTAHTYVWNDEQTEAFREVAGLDVPVSYVDLDGEPTEQTYLVPNTNQCKGCHGRDDDNRLLGVITPQLNRRVTRDGAEVEQLAWLAESGVFGAMPPSPEALERFADPFGAEPLEARARSYLAANCSHCHRPGGGGGDSGLVLLAWEEELSKIGVCKTPAAAGAGTGGRTHDIVPGHPEQSIMTFRMQSTDPEIKMPELPNLLSDERGVELISSWIAGMQPEGCP